MELARLQEFVAERLDRVVGQLTVIVKSAHVYEPEWALMTKLAGSASATGDQG